MAGVKGRSGRKSKDEEDKAQSNAIKAIVSKLGGEVEAFEILATHAKEGSFNHMKLLLEYAYGKPKERLEVTDDRMPAEITFNVIEKK